MKKKILVVEDEAITALGLETMLMDWGYEVMGPYLTGELALRDAEKQRPDLALMDVRLASLMSGLYAAIELRQRFDVPSVFMTGQNTVETRQVAQRAQPAAFLVKPVPADVLRQTIEAALAQNTAP